MVVMAVTTVSDSLTSITSSLYITVLAGDGSDDGDEVGR